jgi:hypothetical protein
VAGCAAGGIFWPGPTQAGRWLLVQFGTNEASCVTPYSDWTQVLRHPRYSQFVRPDNEPSHQGIIESGTPPETEWAYFGVRGTTPIALRRGHKIIATFYNQTENFVLLNARVSFTDSDSPDPVDSSHPWFTLQNRRYRDNGEWMPPQELVEMEYYIADGDRLNAVDGPASTGLCRLINISKPDRDPTFVLTRIELSDEADWSPPGPPQNLGARAAATTRDVTGNLVQLSWNPAADGVTNATGISRYLIYRDGALYDTVDEETSAYLGTNLTYVDLNVAPGRTYTYTVTALDKAPNGTYPVSGRTSHRVGNESVPAGPVTIGTPAWRSESLIDPHGQLQYLGGFRLPEGMDEPWSYCGEAMTYYPGGNVGGDPTRELAGSIYLYTHLAREIAEINIPIPGRSTTIAEWPRAALLKGPTNLWPAVYADPEDATRLVSLPAGGADFRVAGLAYHPAANGVAERLYYGTCNFYGSDGAAPGHGWFDLALTQGGGAWFIGGVEPANVYPGLVAKLAFSLPTAWAAQHTGGRSLVVGDTFLSGGEIIIHGPSLYAVAPWEKGRLPAHREAISAIELLRYSDFTTLSNRVLNFHIDEFGKGAAWLEWSHRAAIAISYRRTVGDTWYGDSLGNNDAYFDIPMPIFADKGGSASRWKAGLMLYNPADLAEVCAGRKPAFEPQPYVVYDFDQFSLRPEGGNGEAGGIAFDPVGGYLFYIEHNGEPEPAYALVHVWRLRAPLAAPRLSITLAGRVLAIQWETLNDASTQRLQAAASLDALAQWNFAGPTYTGDGATKVFSREVESGALFYRLVVQSPP